MNASFLELTQTATSLAGALMAIPWMIAADLNLVSVRRRDIIGNRKIIALANLRIARCVLFAQIALFLAGLCTLFLAPPPYNDHPEIAMGRIGVDIIRNVVITRLAMVCVSMFLAYTSYRSWLEERIPISLSSRQNDQSSKEDDAARVVAQIAANQAQASASLAQDAASTAQVTATLAQDAATVISLDNLKSK